MRDLYRYKLLNSIDAEGKVSAIYKIIIELII